MNTLTIIGFILVLILQNGIFTLVSRSRNSGSILWHAPISFLSNGIYFVIHYGMIMPWLLKDIEGKDYGVLSQFGILYAVCTMIGSVLFMWLSINVFEKGKKRVGGNDFNKLEKELKELKEQLRNNKIIKE